MNERTEIEKQLEEAGYEPCERECPDCGAKLWLNVRDWVPMLDGSGQYRTFYSWWCPVCDLEVDERSEHS